MFLANSWHVSRKHNFLLIYANNLTYFATKNQRECLGELWQIRRNPLQMNWIDKFIVNPYDSIDKLIVNLL